MRDTVVPPSADKRMGKSLANSARVCRHIPHGAPSGGLSTLGPSLDVPGVMTAIAMGVRSPAAIICVMAERSAQMDKP